MSPSSCDVFANLEGCVESASAFGGAGLFPPDPLPTFSGDLGVSAAGGVTCGGKVKFSASNFIAADASILPSWNKETKASVVALAH